MIMEISHNIIVIEIKISKSQFVVIVINTMIYF